MPSFVSKVTDLETLGPLIGVTLWPGPDARSELSPCIDTIAQIDTSSPYTLIQEGLATALGLEPVQTVKLLTVTGMVRVRGCYVYRLTLEFPQHDASYAFGIFAVEVPWMVDEDNRVKCRIGRDVLQFGRLLYNGKDNIFSLSF